MEIEVSRKTDDATWWQTFHDLEASLCRLCDEARREDCPERLDVIAAMLHQVEGRLLEDFQGHEWARESARPVHPALHPLMERLEEALRYGASLWEWKAAGIRARLKAAPRGA